MFGSHQRTHKPVWSLNLGQMSLLQLLRSQLTVIEETNLVE